jgi:S1-C subfamily serine protease
MINKKTFWGMLALVLGFSLVGCMATPAPVPARSTPAPARSEQDIATEAQAKKDNARKAWPGMTVQSDAKGVVVTQVTPWSPAAIIGLHPRDRITAMNDTTVRDTAEFNKVLRDVRSEGFWIAYEREGRSYETTWIDHVR